MFHTEKSENALVIFYMELILFKLIIGLNFRIPRHLFAFHRIRISSIVLSLVLQKMPHRGNNSG